MINYKQFTVGIEEEYMVIDPATKALVSHEQKIVAEGQKIISEKATGKVNNNCPVSGFRADAIFSFTESMRLASPSTL